MGIACCEAVDNHEQISLFTIIHFNDVYDIQPNKHGMYGAANFQALLRSIKNRYPESLVVFSGDAFSPSLLSGIYRGRQMVKCLNKMQIDAACFGNHQFDLEPQETDSLVKKCNFPWLLGNIRYKGTQQTLGKGKPFIIKQIKGKKIGMFGVGGDDWLGILQNYDGKLEYDDSIQFSKKMCKRLRDQEKCDFVIAITHLREAQDRKLAKNVPEIDIILGGHDHMKMQQIVGNVPVVKSGDDFESLSVIKVYEKDQVVTAEFKTQRYDFDMKIIETPNTDNPDPQLKFLIDFCWQQYIRDDRLIGFTEVDLEGRFEQFRCKQTNLGNFWADTARAYYGSDACIINSGSIRNDEVLDKGKLTYFTLSNIINNSLLVLKIPGSVIYHILQQSLENFPDAQSGNFLLISGIKYTFKTKADPKIQQIIINGQKLDLGRLYTVTMPEYLANGGDGYKILESCKRQIDTVHSIDMLSLINKFFTVKSVQGVDGWEQTHQDSKQQNNILPPVSKPAPGFLGGILSFANKQAQRFDRMKKLSTGTCLGNDGRVYVKIAPKLDGRITCIDNVQNSAIKIDSTQIKKQGQNKNQSGNFLSFLAKPTQPVQQPLSILHFSDAFDIQPDEKQKGGIINFQKHTTSLRQKNKNSLLLFSGGAFAPSKLSQMFEGYQMLNSLNSLKIDAACVSAHQLHYKISHTKQLIQNCNFPWLLGNIKCRQSKQLWADHTIKTISKKTVGIFGFASQSFLQSADPDRKYLDYQDWKIYAKQKTQYLKNEKKCDLIIALCHQLPQDGEKLSQICPKIDLLLYGNCKGGVSNLNQIPYVRSGKNFKHYSNIEVFSKQSKKQTNQEGHTYNYKIQCKSIPKANKGINNKLKQYVDGCLKAYNNYSQVIGLTKVPLEIRKSQIRQKQTNFGNLMSDLVKAYFNCDCAIMEPQILNVDRVISAGKLTISSFKDIQSCQNHVRILPGKIIKKLINTEYHQVLMVSGIKYEIDRRQNKNQITFIEINGQPLQEEKIYEVALPKAIKNQKLQLIEKYQIKKVLTKGSDIQSLLMKLFLCSSNINTQTTMQRNLNKLRKLQQTGKHGQSIFSITPLIQGRINIIEQNQKVDLENEQNIDINLTILPSIKQTKNDTKQISSKFSSSRTTPLSEQSRNSESLRQTISNQIDQMNQKLADQMIIQQEESTNMNQMKIEPPNSPLGFILNRNDQSQKHPKVLDQTSCNNIKIQQNPKRAGKRESNNSLFGFQPISEKQNNSNKSISNCFAPKI